MVVACSSLFADSTGWHDLVEIISIVVYKIETTKTMVIRPAGEKIVEVFYFEELTVSCELPFHWIACSQRWDYLH